MKGRGMNPLAMNMLKSLERKKNCHAEDSNQQILSLKSCRLLTASGARKGILKAHKPSPNNPSFLTTLRKLCEKEKILVTSIFSFSNNVFYCYIPFFFFLFLPWIGPLTRKTDLFPMPINDLFFRKIKFKVSQKLSLSLPRPQIKDEGMKCANFIHLSLHSFFGFPTATLYIYSNYQRCHWLKKVNSHIHYSLFWGVHWSQSIHSNIFTSLGPVYSFRWIR